VISYGMAELNSTFYMYNGAWSQHNDLLGAGRSGVRTPVGEGNFLFTMAVQTGRGAHPASSMMGIAPLLRGKVAAAWC
jgi:hypothetical protein